ASCRRLSPSRSIEWTLSVSELLEGFSVAKRFGGSQRDAAEAEAQAAQAFTDLHDSIQEGRSAVAAEMVIIEDPASTPEQVQLAEEQLLSVRHNLDEADGIRRFLLQQRCAWLHRLSE